MELRHLRYFVAVAEELNLTRAAARLRVAQPALSRQMHDLEEELQTPLMDRGRAGVQLTRAGKVFYQRARGILAQTVEAMNEARTAAGLISGRLVLGFLSGLPLNHLASAIEKFRRQHPKVELDYVQGGTSQQLKALREGRLDVAFVNLPAPLDGLEHCVIWRVPFEVVLPRRHPLTQRREFELAELQGEDFVFCTRESRPEFYDDFFRHCSNAGFRPRVVKEAGGYPTSMLALVAAGVGVGVLPHFPDTERITGLAWRPLTKPKLWMDFGLVWQRKAASRVVKEFLAAMAKEFPVLEESTEAISSSRQKS
jgi:DNA-binding transcriptional LysR family regulator